jgi:protease-4
MGRNIVYAFAVLGTLVVVAIVFGLFSIGLGRLQSGVPEATILELDLTGGLIEDVPQTPLAQALLRERILVRDVVEALSRAAEDERVVGLVARVGTGFQWPGKVQEIRDAVLDFRSRGKSAIAFADTFGSEAQFVGSAGTINYYLATAFDEIHLLPMGHVGMAGLALESPFVRGALDKLGVEPRWDSREEYKNAKNVITDRGFTDPHRESFARIVESQYARIAEDIADARGLSRQKVERLTSRGAFDAEAALEAGLIDAISYRDEAYASAKERAGEDGELLYLRTYLAHSDDPPQDAPAIALIYGVGNVIQGRSGFEPVSGTMLMGADSVTAAFRAAIDDDEVQAIVFRIDSGGGSAVASQLMWHETQRAREQGKPVIATMSDIAGSGGYFIAMGADRIVAQPGTLTGSIGVVTGKLVTGKFWDDLGISFDEVRTHPNASMWNGIRDFTPEQWELFQAWLDHVYAQFTAGVAAGRGLSPEEVAKIARGRIWTGSDAKDLGLVDELGGLTLAFSLAKEAAGIAEEVRVRVKIFPAAKTPLDLLIAELRGEAPRSSEDVGVALVVGTLEALEPMQRLAGSLGLGVRAGPLAMPRFVRP